MIDFNEKNQTAKILLKYYCETTNQTDKFQWNSEKEDEQWTLPTLEEVKDEQKAEELMSKIRFFILESNNEDSSLNECDINNVILSSIEGLLHPLLDKVIAAWLSNVFDSGEMLDTEEKIVMYLKREVNMFLTEPKIQDIEVIDFEIDTSKLEIGMVVKNYSELCKLVGEPKYRSGTNQENAQKKKLKRFFNWDKSEFGGRKLIITDIYDEPLPKDDKRKLGNNSIYLKYIETILLKYVSQKNKSNQVCYITKNQLWQILGMINKNYKKIPLTKLKNDIEYSDVKEWELNNFYMRCNSKLNSILYSALNNLKNRSLIMWETQIIIVTKDKKDKHEHHYPATDDEIKKILAVERKILKDMGFESKNHVMCKMKMPQFYESVNTMLFALYGWQRKYERIKLIFNQNDVQEALKQDEYRLQMMLLNDLIIDAVDKNAQTTVDNRMKKALKEYEEYTKDYLGKPPRIEEVGEIFTYPKYFVGIQKRLSQKFLSIKHAEEEKKTNSREVYEDKELDELFANLGIE